MLGLRCISLISKNQRYLCRGSGSAVNPKSCKLEQSIIKWEGVFGLRHISLISKNQRHLCSVSDVSLNSPASSQTPPVKRIRVTFYSKINYGSMQKLFSSIAGYFSGLQRIGADQANNSYYNVSGERWVVFGYGDEISIPVEWIDWLSWKRMEAPTLEETIEQQTSCRLIIPSEDECEDYTYTPFYRYVKGMCLSKDGMFLRIYGNLVECYGNSYLFSAEKKLDYNGDVEVSSELPEYDFDFFVVDSLEKLIELLAVKTNPLIRDKHEEFGAAKGLSSPKPAEVEHHDYYHAFKGRTSIFSYISNIFHFLLCRANRIGDPNECAPRNIISRDS